MLVDLVARVRACRICVEAPVGRPLPHDPRPVLRVSITARLLISGQAPGTRVHQSGLPFDDRSGVRLRAWLGLTREQFYDAERVAFLPMGLCFPGLDVAGGDLPPRPECARAWRQSLLDHLPAVRLIVLVGGYAMRWHLTDRRREPLGRTVAQWRPIFEASAGPDGTRPRLFPLPHPSWRNTAWLRDNPWLEAEALPALRTAIRDLCPEERRLDDDGGVSPGHV